MQHIFSYSDLQLLCELARRVLEGKALPEVLCQPVDAIEAMAKHRDSPKGQAILDRARDLYECEGDLEIVIDDGTILYHNESDGHWVMAWCYVGDEEKETVEGDEEVGDADTPFTTGPA